MGKARSIFGRNIPIAGTGREDDGLLDPDPRTISKELLARRDFIPATGLNLLVAAWVQFEVHDWMSHGENPDEKDVWTLPAKHTGPFPHPKEMTVRRTAHDRDDAPTTYRNQQTHWWDASQVYGSTCELANGLRDGARGRLRLTEDRYPYDPPDEEGRAERAAAAAEQLVGRPGHVPHPVRPRAQRDLQTPRRDPSRTGS